MEVSGGMSGRLRTYSDSNGDLGPESDALLSLICETGQSWSSVELRGLDYEAYLAGLDSSDRARPHPSGSRVR